MNRNGIFEVDTSSLFALSPLLKSHSNASLLFQIEYHLQILEASGNQKASGYFRQRISLAVRKVNIAIH